MVVRKQSRRHCNFSLMALLLVLLIMVASAPAAAGTTGQAKVDRLVMGLITPYLDYMRPWINPITRRSTLAWPAVPAAAGADVTMTSMTRSNAMREKLQRSLDCLRTTIEPPDSLRCGCRDVQSLARTRKPSCTGT